MNIKKIREKLLLTQKEFADLFGVSLISVGNWELRNVEPRAKTKRKIIEYCKLNGIEYEK